MLDEVGKIPWTVPAMIIIAVWRYTQVQQVDWMIGMAAMFVALRLGTWVRGTLAARKQGADEKTADGAEPTGHRSRQRPAGSADGDAKPPAQDRTEAGDKVKSSGETWRRSTPR